jgi:hypothetical protein
MSIDTLSRSSPSRFKSAEAEFLDENPDKSLFTVTSTLYSFALGFLFLQTHVTSYSFYIVTVHCKGESRKT